MTVATHKYAVISPEYSYHERVTDDGEGPWYPTCDYVEVEATSKREAITMASHDRDWKWTKIARGDGVNPFSGVKAYVECDCTTVITYSVATREPDQWGFDDVCEKCHGSSWVGMS